MLCGEQEVKGEDRLNEEGGRMEAQYTDTLFIFYFLLQGQLTVRITLEGRDGRDIETRQKSHT